MANPEKNPFKPNDVLHSDNHTRLSPEAIAKAMARHLREHPAAATHNAKRMQKTTPRG